MTITHVVTNEMFEAGPADQPQLIRMNQHFSGNNRSQRASTTGWWTDEEHEKFLEAIELHPSGPWKKIARHVGTRTPRQVMTHAQKYRQRIKRRKTLEAEDSQKLLDLLLSSLEPLPLVSNLEMQEQRTEDNSEIDSLLLEELQHLTGPATSGVFAELSFLNGDELMELLLDPVIDWEIV
ncbi:unnamed protein product [Phytophthora lilii]|uniref:Unnamed protein product n=1 Tax=Phytophthora lilii TaxID=2077276 RepID=A0A9W6TL76_9STRA|nr:unnamed protein product [Phytophthora lilii]